ncbi:hypothetical protein [Pseudomarimonas salicorniae]|uniref:Tetratricopeptide repeat-containing protein n=1 Tax=Pseudomarimonas salicorniae TaxID=2933270 RepID=A0ABT0GJY1_9GAMM|nr:hypothetical protein [Lysobacter sp. CAU 1642]MCK7594718.1 hypothetical protein [Lysobacter sp. CAU 1642]
MNDVPSPRRPLSPASVPALLDVLGYPLQGAALAALAAILAVRALAALLPGPIAVLCQGLLWLALYKYALECMAATAQGRRESPDVLAHLDDSIHRRHIWVQVGALALLVAVILLAPDQVVLAALLAAAILPGLILALAIGQNLGAALNPLNWLVVAGRLGPSYVLLALLWLLVSALQFSGAGVFALGGLPDWLAYPCFYLVTHYLVLMQFRWMGLALLAHADQLGYEVRVAERPELLRDREQAAVRRGIASARELGDPGGRADALREAVRLGAAEPVQREYRIALRAAGRREELDAHARVRASELVVLGELKSAAALANEALQDNPQFSLPEAEPLERLLDHLERLGQWRNALALALNYRRSFPKRRDSLRLASRAAGILADQLDEPAEAAALLDEALEQAVPLGEQAPLEALRQRLASGLPLRSPIRPSG